MLRLYNTARTLRVDLLTTEYRTKMVDQKLLSILCCPETKQDVSLVSEDIVKTVNGRIAKGEVKNRAGEIVKERIDAGLLREDKKFLYPIREDIPIMLIDEAIPFDGFDVA